MSPTMNPARFIRSPIHSSCTTSTSAFYGRHVAQFGERGPAALNATQFEIDLEIPNSKQIAVSHLGKSIEEKLGAGLKLF